MAHWTDPYCRSPSRAFWIVDSSFLDGGTAGCWCPTRSPRRDVRRVPGWRWFVERSAGPPLHVTPPRVGLLRRGSSRLSWVVGSFVVDATLGRFHGTGSDAVASRSKLIDRKS